MKIAFRGSVELAMDICDDNGILQYCVPLETTPEYHQVLLAKFGNGITWQVEKEKK